MRWRALISSTALALTVAAGAALGGEVVSRQVETSGSAPPYAVFLNAAPKPLARVTKAPRTSAGTAGPKAEQPRSRPGNPGGEVDSATQIVPEAANRRAARAAAITPRAVGEEGLPFTTSRVELAPNARKPVVGSYYPYRAVGRLGFKAAGLNTWCTATLIDRSLIITAAQCVAKFGSGKIFDGAQWSFIPGYFKGKGAYGTYAAQEVFVPKSYLDGTDVCDPDNPGAVCENDVAVIVLAPARKKYAGDKAGWLGVMTGSLTGSVQYPDAQVTQLGYPDMIDNGEQLIRNDSAAYAGTTAPYNTEIGSPFTDGSAGAPLVVDFGMKPAYASGAEPEKTGENMIVGVTSWSLDAGGMKMGASPFTPANVGQLITAACTKYPLACTKR